MVVRTAERGSSNIKYAGNRDRNEHARVCCGVAICRYGSMQVCESCAPKKSGEGKLHRSSIVDAVDACFLDDVIHPLSLPLVFVVVKSILRVPTCPLCLYFLLMSFMSVAVLCTQLTITRLVFFATLADQRKREEERIMFNMLGFINII